jgi:hypothetical protein
MKRFFSSLFVGCCLLVPADSTHSQEVPCICTVKGDDITCDSTGGSRVATAQQTINDFQNSCMSVRCSGGSCVNDNSDPITVDVSEEEWNTLRSDYIPAAAEGSWRANTEGFYCAEVHICNECKYLEARPGKPAGTYCAVGTYKAKQIRGWMNCPSESGPCTGIGGGGSAPE